MTTKEIADELGVDKQKIYRFIVKNHITASNQVKQSKLYDETAQMLIKSGFDHITTSKKRSGEPHQKSSYDVVHDKFLEQLVKELEVKNELLKEKDRQIAEKDRQINAVNNMLADSQRLLDQQQQLNAITEQKLLIAADNEKEQLKGFWKKIFGKRE